VAEERLLSSAVRPYSLHGCALRLLPGPRQDVERLDHGAVGVANNVCDKPEPRIAVCDGSDVCPLRCGTPLDDIRVSSAESPLPGFRTSSASE
jgi:hypothetical protein